MDVGQELRVARERQGLTLQQLSNSTKISPRVLQAIEAADEARLPAWVFTRAFVRTYAHEVGLDPEDTLARYLSQFEPEDKEPPTAPAQHYTAPAGAARALPAAIAFGSNIPTPVVLAVVLVLIVSITAWQRHREPAGTAAHPAAAAAAGLTPAPAAQEVPVGTAGTTPAPAGPLKLSIAASGPCWVRATVGDQQVLAGLLNAGDKRAVDVPSDVTLRIGDPATFAFTINGKPGRAVGSPGQPVTLHITRENYQQYLAR
jgi:cytoskeleton protein RodZ